MNDVITIEDTEMKIREYNGQRVVTFRDIDEVHKRPKGTAKRNFTRNKKHFIEGVDYYKVNRKDVGTNFVLTYGFSDKAPEGLLFTESGYLMLVKSFKDDLAWNVQRQLVNGYFAARNMQEKHFFPKDRDWFRNNEDKINFICTCEGFSTKAFMHIVLRMIGKTYYFDGARSQYVRETGEECPTNSDVITYFDNIREEADLILQAAYNKAIEKVELTDQKQNFKTLKRKQ